MSCRDGCQGGAHAGVGGQWLCLPGKWEHAFFRVSNAHQCFSDSHRCRTPSWDGAAVLGFPLQDAVFHTPVVNKILRQKVLLESIALRCQLPLSSPVNRVSLSSLFPCLLSCLFRHMLPPLNTQPPLLFPHFPAIVFSHLHWDPGALGQGLGLWLAGESPCGLRRSALTAFHVECLNSRWRLFWCELLKSLVEQIVLSGSR